MAQDWQSASEQVFGRCLDGRESLIKYQASWFMPPYDDAFEKLKDGATKTDIIRILSTSSYQAAIHAAQSLNGAGEDIDWVSVLHRAAKQNEAADKSDRVTKKLRKGQDVDVTELIELLKDLINPEMVGLVSANLIDYDSFTELIPSGWDALDYNLGGIPHAAPLIVGGETGLGKSFFSMFFVKKFLELYPDKNAVIYSLEMPSAQYLQRMVRVYKMKNLVDSGRIYISSKAVTIDDIAAESATIPNCGLIVCDYVDYLVPQNNEDAYARVYKKCNEICRTLEIPFLMIVQPNRNQYVDPVPRPYHIRYSGMAENVASQIIMLWKPNPGQTEDDYEEHEKASGFTFIEDSMYMVCWKNRAGWVGLDEDTPLPLDGKKRPGPGAIVLPKVPGIWADEKGQWIRYGDVKTSMKKLRKKRI